MQGPFIAALNVKPKLSETNNVAFIQMFFLYRWLLLKADLTVSIQCHSCHQLQIHLLYICLLIFYPICVSLFMKEDLRVITIIIMIIIIMIITIMSILYKEPFRRKMLEALWLLGEPFPYPNSQTCTNGVFNQFSLFVYEYIVYLDVGYIDNMNNTRNE